MALRGATERRITDWWNRPIEWAHSVSLRLLEWFTQERWNLLLTILALIVANLVILQFLLQGQDNRAIAFVILALIAPLMWVIPELSVAVLIIAGSSLLVNAMYFAAGPGGGTGQRTLILTFLGIVTLRAMYESLRVPREQRPQLLNWFTGILLLFWVYYMGHVVHLYLFRYHEIPYDRQADFALGIYRPIIFRYLDYHMLWIGIFPVMFLMREWQRAKRTLTIVGIVVALGVITLIVEYFAPLPVFWKILFQIKGAGESDEGYRVRDPAVMYLMVAGLFTAIYSLGYLRGWKNALAIVYILAATYGVFITKNRALWAAIAPIVPLALLWKPPSALMKQLSVLGVVILLLTTCMLHPAFNEAVFRQWNEVVERWQRNYAYGGDPRNDPSYQARLREKEAWEVTMSRLSWSERLVGIGLRKPYGHYVYTKEISYRKVYIEKTSMHFSWLYRLLSIGLIGTALLALTLAAALIRIAWAFLVVKHPHIRMLLMGVGAGTVAAIGYDMIHSHPLNTERVYPIILLWSLAELAFHWQRTGQLQDEHAQPTLSEVS